MTHQIRELDYPLLLERLGVRAERRGHWLWSSCPHPDHRDSDPSWRLCDEPGNDKRGTHKCFGCGAWGGPVRLVEWVLGCTREEALEWLDDVEGQVPPLPLDVEVFEAEGPAQRKALVMPPGVVQAPLDEWPEEPFEYLVHERGVEPWQVERWQICYAPRGWHQEHNPLAGRIVLPVRDARGTLLSYTGRAYDGNNRRYREPTKAEGADQGAVFGEQHWPQQCGAEHVVVTEGALDALAVERAVDWHVAGLYGSQLHESHVARVSRFGVVLVASDPDQAGRGLLQKLTGALARSSAVHRVRVPEGEDCASMPRDALAAVLCVALGKARPARHN